MGMGDELMAAGEAAALAARAGLPVTILDINMRPRRHKVWTHCQDVDMAGGRGPRIVNGPSCRPYIDYAASTPERWAWKLYRPQRARLSIGADLLAWAETYAGSVIVEPNVKYNAPVGKSWGPERWQALVDAWPGLPWLQVSVPGTHRLRGVRHVEPPTFGHLFAVLARSQAAVLPEGGLHHAAAAVRLPAVVLFGGYISPETTGYAEHVNIFTGGEACGLRSPCEHCRQAMAAITVDRVLAALGLILEGV